MISRRESEVPHFTLHELIITITPIKIYPESICFYYIAINSIAFSLGSLYYSYSYQINIINPLFISHLGCIKFNY